MYRRRMIEFLESYRNVITDPDDYTTKELESFVQKEIEDRDLNEKEVWEDLEQS